MQAKPSAITLHIGSEETQVDVGSSVLSMTLGTEITVLGYFRHQPPTPAEMETAIMVVEDEIMRIRYDIPTDARLISYDQAIRAIAHLAGVAEDENMQLTVDAVERTFDRLSLVINGRSAHVEGIPASNEFAATLLILREFMHHLGFKQIEVKGAKVTL